MASTETRSGFRLPWSPERSHDDLAAGSSAEPTPEATDPTTGAGDLAWPETDLNARPTFDSPAPGTTEAELGDGPTAEESPMPDTNPATSAPPETPRKPSKLMSDLSAAIRATAEAARDQALAQADVDARQTKEAIREQSTEGATALRQRSDEDIAAIRDWSKAEIARIREETDQKISDRKAALDEELSEHAASVERRVNEVDGEVTRHQEAMDAYLERLHKEHDPARLATLAETMPEAPSFEAWFDAAADEADIEAEATTEPETADAAADEAAVETEAMGEVEPVAEDAATSIAEGELETTGDVEPAAEVDPVPDAETVDGVEAAAAPEVKAETPGTAWAESQGDWTTPTPADAANDGDDTPRWAAGETPEGFPATDETGDPVDRGAIMAALEAAAEAVVAAESASDSADQAEAAADAAETAAELFRPRETEEGEAVEPAADAAPRTADEESESFAGRLASLLPGHGGAGDGNGEPQTSKVIATGLISVASIASFKRHLGRVAGVQGVSVSSGPDGEFVFSVTHRPDVAFRDVIPTLPGFAARVISAEDGVIRVTAQDPEAES